ncbi:MAG: Fic family protein [Dissulfurispiraceae bacterium]
MRDHTALEAALGAPKVSFGGAYLMNLFEMAATYVESVCANHPFLDVNKKSWYCMCFDVSLFKWL